MSTPPEPAPGTAWLDTSVEPGAPDVVVVVTPPLEQKKRTAAKVTRYSIPWAILIPLIGWEFIAIKRGYEGGPLTHVVGWAYGSEYSWRWWLLSGVVDGLLLWAMPHFRWPHIFDAGWLLASIALMLVVGVVGALSTA